jgi:hypothetical protein
MGDAYVDAQLGKFDVEFKPQEKSGAGDSGRKVSEAAGLPRRDEAGSPVYQVGLTLRLP